MRLIETAGAIVIGGLLIGCSGSGPGSGPKASAPAGATLSAADEQTAAELQRTYRASHPGQQVGYVNAVDPGRRIVSVAGIPSELVRPGAIVSILTTGGGTVEAVAYAHDYGYVQLRYQPLGPGQAAPATGELAIWNPGGQVVVPESLPPAGVPTSAPPPSTGTGTTGIGTTGAGITTTAPAEPPPPPPPAATLPADQSRPLTDLQPPATQPAVPPPTNTETPPPPPPPPIAPATRPAPDLNK